MRTVKHRLQRVAAPCLAIAGLALVSGACWPDSIDMDGATYENVYIREGETFYYVQIPSTGRVISVRKQAVPSGDVHITKERSKRAALLKQWKAAHRERRLDTGEDDAIAGKGVSDVLKETVLKDGASGIEVPAKPKGEAPRWPLLANRPRGRRSARPVFISETGVVVCTNRPERYRNKADYIEVVLDFDPIVVPRRYRPSGKGDAARTARYTPSHVKDLVNYYARAYRLDPNLVLAVIRQESNFTVRATSPKGACGLMQLMPGTALEMGVSDLYDPAENIAGGAQYLAKMLWLFDNDLDLALAGYNAGPATVQRYGGIPPFPETRDYVQRVKGFYRQYAGGRETVARVDTQARPAAAASEPGHAPYLVEFKNGWTQPADEIAESDSLYFITVAERTTQIRKEHVRAIRSRETG